ncbi:cyclin C [Acrasis kona]|uniref:Cyclin C n=1 Tax=Acrasis kona TaxID=1008807 RepID=A0AAW2Z8K2_9EUKA
MATNFWRSSHSKTISSNTNTNNAIIEQDLSQIPPGHIFTDKEKELLLLHHMDELRNYGTKLQMHQRVIATAMVYFKRFFANNQIRDCDPLLLVPTVLLMASKIEECPINCKSILKILPSEFTNLYSMQNIIDCEIHLMEQLDFNLTIYHPYKQLELYIESLHLENDVALVQSAWNFMNDSYYSDACLQFSPHLIALASVYMAHLFGRVDLDEAQQKQFKERDDRIKKWFDTLNVHMRQIGAITNQILDLYKTLQESRTGDVLATPLLKITKMRMANVWRTNQPSYPPQQQAIPPQQQMRN